MTVDELMNLPPIKLQSAVDNLPIQQVDELRRQAETILMAAAFRVGYLKARHNAGGGDDGHAKAAKNANTHLIAVRRLLHYTYPAQGKINI